MSKKMYLFVSGGIFGLVAIIHIVRALLNLSVQVGSRQLPVWPSWAGAVVSMGLCLWALRLATRES